MFSEVELRRKVAVRVKNPKNRSRRVISRSFIVTRLLQYLAFEKATKDDGYLLSVTQLKSIDEGDLKQGGSGSGQQQEEVFYYYIFPVAFRCRSFLPLRGEILGGTVHHTCRLGVFLRCGPLRLIFLSARKMPEFRCVLYGEPEPNPSPSPIPKPYFVHDKLGKIELGVRVRFVVLDVRWIEKDGDICREFMMPASLVGPDSVLLGPVPEPDLDQLHH